MKLFRLYLSWRVCDWLDRRGLRWVAMLVDCVLRV